MTDLQMTLFVVAFGAVLGGMFSILGMVVNSRLTQSRERRQLAWRIEVERIVDLEERAGQVTELVQSHLSPETIRDRAQDDLDWLASAAGRLRRHRGLMLATRDLHNGLLRLLDDKLRHEDYRATEAEVNTLHQALLERCDEVTGNRKV